VPSNPLLHTVDLGAVADACQEGGVPLLVDDTVCSHLNIDTLAYADAASTSLTKWVSGVGDVLAGSIRLRNDSQFSDEFREALEREVPGGSRLYYRDGDALVRNASDFRARVTECNRNGLLVASFLTDQSEVSEVWYPASTDREAYEAIRRPNGGFGGLISFTLKEADKTAALYEAMQFCKGPSLGTDYTLLCPYTMLAHYREMAWARSCGVSEALLRFSVGREPEEVLLRRLKSAFSALR
jgi:cystathionine gamma-synthase